MKGGVVSVECLEYGPYTKRMIPRRRGGVSKNKEF